VRKNERRKKGTKEDEEKGKNQRKEGERMGVKNKGTKKERGD
jgi:hypothetical protein